MILRSVAAGSPSVFALSAVGISGNSLASIPLMFDSERLHLRCMLIWRTTISMSIRSGCIEFTQSVSSRAGRVIAPLSSTCAPSQQLTPTSRLVAASFRRLSSVLSRMLPRTGSVLREETARPTMDRPFEKFSWRTERRMMQPPAGK